MPELASYSRSDVSTHNSRDSLWVINNNKIYDISSFNDAHPGGSEWLLKFGGQDVTFVMNDKDLHGHSSHAFNLLDDFLIGQIIETEKWDPYSESSDKSSSNPSTASKIGIASDKFIDPNKPIFTQIWNSNFTKEFYLEQVHIPRHTPGTAVYFENSILELLTRTPWWLVPLFWVPIIYIMYTNGLTYTDNTTMLRMFIVGAAIWPMFEYLIHRFVFHVDEYIPEGTLSQVGHFTLHGFHHFLPMDNMRLVMPPVLSSFLAVCLYTPLSFLVPAGIRHGVFCGVVTMYIVYDEVHYWLHHGFFKWNLIKKLKSYHLEHHYREYKLGFGITSDLVDRVFNTTFTSTKVHIE
ncbi:Ceramide very long chain fatty acid hydroxylase SCS7 [Smittium culicis]|uniref:Ceramide very long chain fatty acid hydroxylase n=1 Tax=Smittium culicis TaxID=133412 RepID=A0A1R1XB42_9FUNG|nr:Ceramide very long chain fatty acid hydroxylase SCS7 [Smittium culicis]